MSAHLLKFVALLLLSSPFVLCDSNTIKELTVYNQKGAPHQIVSVSPGESQFLTLKFIEGKISDYDFYVQNTSGTGSIYQLAKNYIVHGYDPKQGTKIEIGFMTSGKKFPLTSSTPKLANPGKVEVTDPQKRILYMRPSPDRTTTNQKYASVEYVLVRKIDGYVSDPGFIYVVPPTNALEGSDFTFFDKVNTDANTDGWRIFGNNRIVSSVNGNAHFYPSTLPNYEDFKLGELHKNYLVGHEELIDIQEFGQSDRQLWYFDAPSKFLGNQAIAYGGHFSFSIASLSGDFSDMNDVSTLNAVELTCDSCDGPVRKGMKVVYRVSRLPQMFTGAAQRITLHLFETAGWLKESQDVLVPWTAPTQCDMLQLLGRLSSVRILGDYTKGYESIALDDVLLSNAIVQIPTCAIYKSDCSICLCDA